MALDEILITRAIIERYTEKLLDNLDLEVAVVGGGMFLSGNKAAQLIHERLTKEG